MRLGMNVVGIPGREHICSPDYCHSVVVGFAAHVQQLQVTISQLCTRAPNLFGVRAAAQLSSASFWRLRSQWFCGHRTITHTHKLQSQIIPEIVEHTTQNVCAQHNNMRCIHETTDGGGAIFM